MDHINHIDQLVRLIADDEATAEQRAEFERLVQTRPELIAAAEAEGRLRSAVGRVMVAEAAKSHPTDLASRVRQAADGAGSPAARRHRRRSPAIRGVGAVRHALRRNIVPSGLAAGILILVTAAIIAGLLSRSPSAPWSPYGDPAAKLVNVFIDAHHWSVDHPAAWNEEIEFRTYEDVRVWLEQSCASAASALPEFESHGYEFVGAMRLADALHMRFASQTTDADISFYIQSIAVLDDQDTLTLEPGVGYRSVSAPAPGAGSSGVKRSFLWISGDCIYVLVNGDNLETTIALAREAGMPAGEIRDF